MGSVKHLDFTKKDDSDPGAFTLADFYAASIEELKKEGKISLNTFLDICREEGLQPYKEYSGKFNLRVPPELHSTIAAKAASEGKSLNKFVTDVLSRTIEESNAGV